VKVLDLFSGAAGGWSLGMHRAGFRTVAACEVVPWRRAVYLENNPGVVMYDDVQALTAERLLADLGELPDVVVGSPPCQDISSANTGGRGVDGDKSRLFFEFTRLVGELRPRWLAAENSANLRNRGGDRVLAALEAHGYACESLVVRAGTRPGFAPAGVGANHERPRVWIIGFDLHAARLGRKDRRPWHGGAPAPGSDAADAGGARHPIGQGQRGDLGAAAGAPAERDAGAGHEPDAHGQGQPDGAQHGEMGRGADAGGDAGEPWADWNGGLARHLRVDDGLSAWLAGQRLAVGGPRGTAASHLAVEAYGDAVLPQIPEAIGRAILRVEDLLTLI
jgi:DNA (cytosine-5)-methyltransferase 1